MADTIGGNLINGLFLAKLSLTGNNTEHYRFLSPQLELKNWNTPLLYSRDRFTSIGSGVDSLMYTYWLQYEWGADTLENVKKYRSPYYPEEPFIAPRAVAFDDQTQHYYVACETGYRPTGTFLNIQTTLFCLDSLGEYLWGIDLGNNWADDPESIAILPNSEVVVGIRQSNTNIEEYDLDFRTRLYALDTLGQTLWTWTSSQSVQKGANDLIAEADGGLVIASARGYLYEINPYVQYVAWDRGLIFKLNAQRQVEWETELYWGGQSHVNHFNRIVAAIDGSGYVAAGEVGFAWEPGPGGMLGYLAKVSPTGDSLWSRRLFYYDPADSLQYNHAIHDLKATPDGGYFMSGQTKEPNGLTSPSQRAWFLKVDSEGCLVPGCGLVDAVEPTAEGPALLLYPNPAQETLNVYLGDAGSEQWTLQVIDAQGRQIGSYAASIGHTTYLLPVADLAAGMYYLRVSDARGRTGKTYAWVKGGD